MWRVMTGDFRYLLIDGVYDAIITDPPYGNFYGSQRKKIKQAVVDGDDLDWLNDFSQRAYELCPKGPIVMFCDRHHRSKIETAMKTNGNFINDAIWFKRPWGIGYNFRPAHEHILMFSKSKTIKAQHYSLSSVLQANKIGKKLHPTQKPVDLMLQLVEGLTPEGSVVLDPFMGSGSTGIACLKSRRRFVGVEKDPLYVKIFEDRIKNET